MTTMEEITSKVKTFEDACLIAGIDPKKRLQLMHECYFDESAIAFEKLKIIISVLNEGWKPNWSNSYERKWYPRFRLVPFEFSDAGYYYGTTHTNSGSRLCFQNEKLAQYCGTQFTDLYKLFMTFTNPKREVLVEKIINSRN